MVVIHGIDTFECSKAAKSDSEIVLYDAQNNEIQHISNIVGEEWNYIQIFNGEWEDLEQMPTQEELFNAKIDKMQADLDYCLMLLEE